MALPFELIFCRQFSIMIGPHWISFGHLWIFGFFCGCPLKSSLFHLVSVCLFAIWLYCSINIWLLNMIKKWWVLNLIVIKCLFVPNLCLVLSDPRVLGHMKGSVKVLHLNMFYFHKNGVILFTLDLHHWAQPCQLL